MAFSITGLGKIGNQSRRGSSPQIYNYRTTDTRATIAAMNYFSNAANILEVGDVIEVQHLSDATNPEGICGYSVFTITFKMTGFIYATQMMGGSVITAVVADVSTAATTAVTVAQAGTISNIKFILKAPITAANSAITFNIGGVAITGSAITAAYAGSAAGTVFTSTPTAANVLAVGNVLNTLSDGGSTGDCEAIAIFTLT